MRTWLKYNTVSAAGFVVQLALLGLLTEVAHWRVVWATAVAVEVAVLHNFVWHWRWTFSGRGVRLAHALLRYHLTTGAVSITGNTLATQAVVDGLGLAPVVANGVATVACYLLNWLLANAVAFRRCRTPGSS